MSIVHRDRDRFDADIADKFNVVLILSGAAGTPAQDVHDSAKQLQHAFRKTWILRHVDVLDPEEQELWLDAPQKYAFYNCDQQETRSWGPVSDLLSADQEPDLLVIRDHFAAAELGDPQP